MMLAHENTRNRESLLRRRFAERLRVSRKSTEVAVRLVFGELRRTLMADDSCTPAPSTEPVAPGTRMVKCVKFGKELPGLDRVPWRGEIGKRIYENVSKDAWKLWIEHSKMIMNEYRLNPLDPNSQKIMEEQLEQFFFGAGAQLPEGYVPPKAKG
jgi:Fe-S cluster biosynthesis and repair protein YggX